MVEPPVPATFLFTDIEGSTRLWEQAPERMRAALARHDAIARAAVESHRGVLVKTTGDGVHAVFARPLDALGATLQLQLDLAPTASDAELALQVRCGLHAGLGERRDNDFFGPVVNRAARIMDAAHGGQVLLSQAVAAQLDGCLPAGIALRDLGRVRLRDLADAEHVYQVLHPRLRADFPALRSLEATPNNLPQQVSSFVGRERELEQCRQLLGQTRLLTLSGAGGLGKTRLALQLAADVLEDFPDGVWFVELAAVGDGALVSQAAASALGVKETAGRPVLEALLQHAGPRRLLIVLDNCEHLVLACAELAKALLAAGAQLKVLASSREPLHVAGESTYPVPALAAPAASRAMTADALAPYAAVRLFTERARAVQPAFHLTDRNAPAIAEICWHLDGIPLALELAAARVRALSVENIAARLGDRFRLLTGGDRTALPRQQSLRALIDWSHDLLTPPERVLLRRLSIFSGGWTLEAAEAVCADAAVAAEQVLDLLTHLVDKSLVVLEANGERYRLLETIRQYAREQLEAAGEKKAMRARHLACYLDLAEKARPELVGPAQGAWLARLDRERENFIAAHRWCDRAPDGADSGFRLLHAIKPYWFMRGLLELGLRLTLHALARPGAQARDAARCLGLANAGQFCSFMGRYGDARRHLGASLAIARERGDEDLVARILQPLGMAALGEGDIVAARVHSEEAVALARKQGNPRELAGAINMLAQLHLFEGALESAAPLFEQVVALARELGDRESIAIGLLNLAMVSVGRNALERARQHLREVLAIVEEIDSAPAGQSLLEVGAGLAAAAGDGVLSARFFGAAEAQAARTGLQRTPADEAFLAAWIERTRQALGAADFAAAEAGGRALGYAEAIAEAREWLRIA
ncbi:MAG: adenylate/guanylate cyclase domain-containing protein [Betaproteobacteria bacterium]|nr:MAG: adenylate/guanylate cyclase domain-containing protein [Betaproteobacteria bacterium]